MKRVAILISGGGSNMLELVQSMTGAHPARAVLVASNDPAASGLGRAAALGIPTAAVDHRPFGRDRAAFEAALLHHIDAAKPDILCPSHGPEIVKNVEGALKQTLGATLEVGFVRSFERYTKERLGNAPEDRAG